MFKKKLYYIRECVNKMQTRNQAIERCVTQKLNYSLEQYNKEIVSMCNYLLTRSNKKVLKNINKLKKKDESNEQ